MSQSFTTLESFLKAKFNSKLPLYKRVSEKPPSFNKWKKDYITGFGFKEWLASMKGITPTENQWFSIVQAYVREGDRKVSDAPALVASLEKHHEINIGPIYGILTVEYWQDRLKTSCKDKNVV